MKGKYLITTDNWFLAPDGKQYKAVWGDVSIVCDEVLGIKTNRASSNWYARVGSQNNHVIVAGCQIHYAVKCEEKPNDNFADDYQVHEGKVILVERPSHIYLAFDEDVSDYPF